jgi:exosome complex RNA-binding protein Rrp42 (RNase PH superfamily)
MKVSVIIVVTESIKKARENIESAINSIGNKSSPDDALADELRRIECELGVINMDLGSYSVDIAHLPCLEGLEEKNKEKK